MDENSNPPNPHSLIALWRGEFPLGRTFGLWGFVGGFSQIAAFLVVIMGLRHIPEGAFGYLLLAWLVWLYVYFVILFMGILRSSVREQEIEPANPLILVSRVFVGLGVLLMVTITVGLVMGGPAPH
ncbi:hypothetical protein V5T82_12025 [Magnetovibrio sp. PR-2]|uniref:hypothetical protein n=1 Tax=Magnetovibrio sp. PR-2 TaxID=3120356 RepID=UPI002FCE57E9